MGHRIITTLSLCLRAADSAQPPSRLEKENSPVQLDGSESTSLEALVLASPIIFTVGSSELPSTVGHFMPASKLLKCHLQLRKTAWVPQSCLFAFTASWLQAFIYDCSCLAYHTETFRFSLIALSRLLN